MIDGSRDREKSIKFLKLIDSGESIASEKTYKQQNYGVKFEYSGSQTPQRKGKLERPFQTI
jgi:hypothetical protein